MTHVCYFSHYNSYNSTQNLVWLPCKIAYYVHHHHHHHHHSYHSSKKRLQKCQWHLLIQSLILLADIWPLKNLTPAIPPKSTFWTRWWFNSHKCWMTQSSIFAYNLHISAHIWVWITHHHIQHKDNYISSGNEQHISDMTHMYLNQQHSKNIFLKTCQLKYRVSSTSTTELTYFSLAFCKDSDFSSFSASSRNFFRLSWQIFIQNMLQNKSRITVSSFKL